jgi:hypothetical protein
MVVDDKLFLEKNVSFIQWLVGLRRKYRASCSLKKKSFEKN